MIGRIALRMATIEVLRGKTAVDQNVLDSRMTALDAGADGILKTDQKKPFIAVYTDDAKLEGGMEARSLHKSGPTALVIEIAIAESMLYRNELNDVEVVAGIPDADDAYEFLLDVIGRQITNALTDPRDEWAELWRSLSSRILKIERKRTADASGVRIAAHQLVITLDLLPDPIFGDPLAAGSTWARFFAKISAQGMPREIASRVSLLQALIGSPDGVADHEAQRRRYGLTVAEARAMMDTAVSPEA